MYSNIVTVNPVVCTVYSMFPNPHTMCRSVVLFTSRNKRAKGVPCNTIRHEVPPLSREVASGMLASLTLTEQQLDVVLGYCGGLPLALSLVQGALAGDPEGAAGLVKRLDDSQPISTVDNYDELFDTVGFSVGLLSESVRQVWFDIAVLLREDTPWEYLEYTYGADVVRELAMRSLIREQSRGYDSPWQTLAVRVAGVHDVLLTYGYQQCVPDSSNYRARSLDMWSEDPLDIPTGSLVGCLCLGPSTSLH
jgi:hypothetical protein